MIPKDLADWLDAEAKRQDRSFAAVIRVKLEELRATSKRRKAA